MKPNPEGAKGKKNARIVVCGNFQTVHPDEMTSSKTPSYPVLRMLLSLASYRGWRIETWDVSTAFLYARLYGDRETDLDGQYIYMREGDREVRAPPGRDHMEAEKGALWFADVTVSLGSGT